MADTCHIIGAGLSGRAAAELLLKQGFQVIISDDADNPELSERLRPFVKRGAVVHLGGNQKALDFKASLVVVSPGVSLDHPAVWARRKQGAEIIGELELGWRFAKGTAIGISGTDGKSTIVSMIHHIFSFAGRNSILCGNIGVPLCSVVDRTTSDSFLVIEVSSYQLETVASFHLHIAGMTNFSADHTVRHGGLENYRRSKARLFERMTSDDFALFNEDDPVVAGMLAGCPAQRIPISLKPPSRYGAGFKAENLIVDLPNGSGAFNMPRSELNLLGLHNVFNALMAAAACRCLKVDSDSIRAALSTFKGLPHRLEVIRELNGVIFINDSKATNVASGMVALEAMSRPVVLIAGGRPKGGGYKELRRLVQARVKKLILIGESALEMAEDWGDLVSFHLVDSLEDAVQIARQSAVAGDVVLLAPCAASFDMFRDFTHRGDQFREIVLGLK